MRRWTRGIRRDDANVAHVERHGVTPAEVEEVLNREPQADVAWVTEYGEERYQTEGFTNAGRELEVIFTYRDTKTRPVTAFPKTTGWRFLQERRAAARAKGVVVYEGGFNEEAREILRSGKSVIFEGGMGITPTDPAKLQALAERAKAKSTEQIALRLPTADLEAAKRLAAKHGIGYQTLLKEIIHDALRQAS